MPEQNPYSFRKPSDMHFVSVRMPLNLWQRLEALAAHKTIAMNSLINALLDLALDYDDTPEGQAKIDAALVFWRTRWEHRVTKRRQNRLPQ